MGQQQLLLLVLATVIVGLATVAGIQAFDENRSQAAADALQQKAATIASDIKGLDEKPQQLGGLPDDLSTVGTSEIANRLGFEDVDSDSGLEVPVSGAGDGAECTIGSTASNTVMVNCVGEGDYGDLNFQGTFNQAPGDGNPQVTVSSFSPSSGG